MSTVEWIIAACLAAQGVATSLALHMAVKEHARKSRESEKPRDEDIHRLHFYCANEPDNACLDCTLVLNPEKSRGSESTQ